MRCSNLLIAHFILLSLPCDEGDNFITGTIPTEIFSISTLLWLELDDLSLVGTLPTEVANVPGLLTLWIGKKMRVCHCHMIFFSFSEGTEHFCSLFHLKRTMR